MTSYISRPDPVSDASPKRQRVVGGSSSLVRLAALGMLPMEVRVLENIPRGASGVGDYGSGVLAWVVAEGYVFLWEPKRQRHNLSPECIRLALPHKVPSHQDAWFLQPFRLKGEANVGIFLASSEGDVVCWPCVSNAVPLVEKIRGFRSSVCRMEAVVSEELVRVVLGAANGLVCMAYLSYKDMCLRTLLVHKPNPPEGRDGLIAIALAQSKRALHAFVLFQNNHLIRFDIVTEGKGNVADDWMVSLQDQVLQEFPGSDEVRGIDLLWVGKLSEGADGTLGLVVMDADRLCVLELNNVLSESSAITEAPFSRRSEDVQVPHGSEPSVACFNDEDCIIVVAFDVHNDLVVCASRNFEPWVANRLQDVSTGWFALAASQPRSGSSVHAFLLSATCVLAMEYDISTTATSGMPQVAKVQSRSRDPTSAPVTPNISRKTRANEVETPTLRQRITSILPFSRSSSSGDEGLSLDDARQVLGIVFRGYLLEEARGGDGLAIAREESKWKALKASSEEVLDVAVMAIAEKELNRKPDQRWVDNDNPSFSQDLIRRHLLTKRSRFEKEGLLGFLERSGLSELLGDRTCIALEGLRHKLHAALRLLQLHSEDKENSSPGVRALSQVVKEVVQHRAKEQNNFDENTFSQNLASAGLTEPDLYYSAVTSIESVLQFLPEKLQGATSENRGDTVDFFNSVFLAILAPVKKDSGFLGSIQVHEEGDDQWMDTDSALEALDKEISATWDTISDRRNKNWEKNYEQIVPKLTELVDLALSCHDRRKTLSEKVSWKYIKPFLIIGDEEDGNGDGQVTESQEKTVGKMSEHVRVVCEKHVCLQGLFSIGEMSSDQYLLQRYIEVSSRSEFTVQRDPQHTSLVQLLDCDGAPLNMGTGDLWKQHRCADDKALYCYSDPGETRWLTLEDGRVHMVQLQKTSLTESQVLEHVPCDAAGNQTVIRIKGFRGRGFLCSRDNSPGAHVLYHAERWGELPGVVFSKLLVHGKGYQALRLARKPYLEMALGRTLERENASGRRGNASLINDVSWLTYLGQRDYAPASQKLKLVDHPTANSLAKLCDRVEELSSA